MKENSCRYYEGSIETADSSKYVHIAADIWIIKTADSLKYIVADTYRGVLKQLVHQNT